MRENGRIKERQANYAQNDGHAQRACFVVLRPEAASLATKMHRWTVS